MTCRSDKTSFEFDAVSPVVGDGVRYYVKNPHAIMMLSNAIGRSHQEIARGTDQADSKGEERSRVDAWVHDRVRGRSRPVMADGCPHVAQERGKRLQCGNGLDRTVRSRRGQARGRAGGSQGTAQPWGWHVSASIKVINRSEWPTWLVRWMVRKACADAGVTRYEWTQVRRSRPWFSGRGGRRDGHGGCNRRALRSLRASWLFRYFAYGPNSPSACWEHIPHTSVAVLAKLIRHEVEHAASPDDYQKFGKWVAEAHCNEMAAKWVNGLAEQWPTVLRDWLRLAREERQRTCKPDASERAAKRLAERAELLKQWQRRLKLAQTKVRKYRASCKAIERRMAATSGGKKYSPNGGT